MGHCEKPAERTRRSRWKLGKTRYDAQRRPKLRRDPAIAAVNLSRVAIIFAPLGDRTKNVSSANEKGRNAPRHNPNEKNENENVAMASVISPQLGAPPARGWGWGGATVAMATDIQLSRLYLFSSLVSSNSSVQISREQEHLSQPTAHSIVFFSLRGGRRGVSLEEIDKDGVFGLGFAGVNTTLAVFFSRQKKDPKQKTSDCDTDPGSLGTSVVLSLACGWPSMAYESGASAASSCSTCSKRQEKTVPKCHSLPERNSTRNRLPREEIKAKRGRPTSRVVRSVLFLFWYRKPGWNNEKPSKIR